MHHDRESVVLEFMARVRQTGDNIRTVRREFRQRDQFAAVEFEEVGIVSTDVVQDLGESPELGTSLRVPHGLVWRHVSRLRPAVVVPE
ncbi:MAG UNVERIFIED_CONTAM: hypothetical protein LVR18_25470 [Planctomycetaceae bacterium]